ncbi:uncharacterized protein LOC141817117 [Curcuma longa]|uniref:uncharacterized protein LOC141817117 n=1 Tax=Curcuma longa TaxID=136217 RepID=UPI003D9F7157
MARMRGRGIVAIWVLLACVCARHPSLVFADTDPNDASVLNVLFGSLNTNSQLTGWKQSGGDPCGERWKGISCSGSSVTKITLSGLGLTGTLGYNMNQLSSLTELDLSKNNLGNGQQIPYTLPTNLHRLDLSNNQFGQTVPYIISQMTSLEYLNLSHNHLQDNLGEMFQSLSNLATMDLSFNSFSGDLPQSSTSLTSLMNLYLQNNQFTGHIDFLANLPLQNLNVENNRFTGWIPNQLKGIKNLQAIGKLEILGYPSPNTENLDMDTDLGTQDVDLPVVACLYSGSGSSGSTSSDSFCRKSNHERKTLLRSTNQILSRRLFSLFIFFPAQHLDAFTDRTFTARHSHPLQQNIPLP